MTEARTITHCRSCGSGVLAEVLDLGSQRLSDFREDDSVPPAYPLRLLLCASCSLLQLADTAPRGELYHHRYSFRSGTSEVIRDDLLDIVTTATEEFAFHNDRAPKTWLDIASNDGTLLSFVDRGAFRVGVDPLEHLADESRQHADEICVQYFDGSTFGDQKFDVVTSVSMFYDLDDPNRFVADVAGVLAREGVWVIQQNYALDMLRGTVFDNICHEHVTYFSLLSLGPLLYQHGLIVTDVTHSPVNGGCFRVFVVHRDRVPKPVLRPAVGDFLYAESDGGTQSADAWLAFGERTRSRVAQLRDWVESTRRHGRQVAVYGASTRGATIWQAAGLGAEHFRYAVERQPVKVGKWMSAIGVPIVAEETLRRDMNLEREPAFAVVGPWFLKDAINARERRAWHYLDIGGRLVYPLPEIEIYGRNGRES